ncbi:MAG: DUF5337 domain-containing protein [Paracoccaceae bacterium]
MAESQDKSSKAGQRLALVIAGTGLAWVLANMLGAHFGWSNRVRALFDLVALAAFAWAIIVAIGIWRNRQDN